MSIGRSKFYVSAPLDYRHSMLADISPASSASTLPSIAGSVDCLTDPHNDRKKKKAKSFSFRPFFSSTSLLNKASSHNKSADSSVDKSSVSSLNKSATDTSKKKKFSKFFSSSNSSLSKCAPRTRCDSSCQTDARPPQNEVGVQTTHSAPAATADVPVQTGSAWADDRYSRAANHGGPSLLTSSSSPYSFLRRPGPRGPFFARKLGETDAGKVGEIGSDHVLSPLDAGRLLKYASPGSDSSTAGPTSEKGGRDGNSPPEARKKVGGATSSSQPHQSIQSDPERTSESSIKECSSKTDSVTHPGTSYKQPEPLKVSAPKSPPLSPKLDNRSGPESTLTSQEAVLSPENGDEKPQVSKLVSFLDKPSALRVERSDSPVKYSAKIKTVHFDLSNGDSNHNDKNESPSFIEKDVQPACLNDNHLPRNLDKDFEDLLRNLDILVDDPIDISEIPKADALKISFDVCPSSPPKQTLLSSKLRSAFDVLHQEVLPPIPETYENCEVEPPVSSNETGEQVTKINSAPEPVADSGENKLPSPSSTRLSEIINNPNILKDDSTKSASVNVFTSSKSDTVEGSENVYDRDFSENVIKTVTLPTLPSFFDSAPKSSQLELSSLTPEDIQISTAEQLDTEREAEEKMLSRSSSRGSVRNNPASDFDGFFNAAKKKFDSCENLDQLEEEIIRSLCEPSDLAQKIPVHENPDATHVRRVALERLLSGDGGFRTPDEIIEVPESKVNARQTYKHVATITKLDHHRNDPELECPVQTSNSNPSDSLCVAPSIPEILNDKKRGISPVSKIDSFNNTSTFYLPEHKPLINDNLARASNGHSTDQRPHYSRESAEDVSRTCDFTHCLRPSEVRNNSLFLDKINFRCSPEKSPLRSASPAIPLSRMQSPKAQITKTEESKGTVDPGIPNSNGQCDFGHCLKPSQVENSALLTHMTVSKFAPGRRQFATNSTLHHVANSDRDSCRDGTTTRDEASHKSEITIVLQTPSSDTKRRSPDGQKFVTVSPVRGTENPPSNSEKPTSVSDTNQGYGTVREVEDPSSDSVVQQSFAPPPPPPLPSSKQSSLGQPSSPKDMFQKQPPSSDQISLNSSSSLSAEPKFSPSKSPVMMELERCFEARRRHSADEQRDQQSNIESNVNPGSFEFHSSPPKTTTYQLADGFGGLHSPTILTDMAPPPGAVLLEERISVDEGAGLRHTDRLFGLPVTEVTRDTTSSAHFRPAPPKYEGIGPCEDGLPLAPRNSVKKENMHNWYKTMFKSLHKTDSSNDNQEYIIGYSSEPETSKTERSPRQKSSGSSTLDGRRNYVVKGKDYSRPSYEARPRLIEDFEPGHSSVTDNVVTLGCKRYLPALNTPKPSYEYTKGYDQDCRYTRNLSPDSSPASPGHYAAVQRGGEVPRFGLGMLAPHKHADPCVGPLPPPPVNYHVPVATPQATRPLTLPATHQTGGQHEMQQTSPSSPSSRSPDLQVAARVLFDFKAESRKEVPLRKDDVVCVWRQLDRNWYEGESRGKTGIFPVAYVEIVPPEHRASPSGSARLLYDFAAHDPVELAARKGECVVLVRRVDANWYEAKLGARRGILPAAYLHVTREPATKSKSPSPQPCLRSPCCSSEPKERPTPLTASPLTPETMSGQRSRTRNLIEPVMYRALYAYSPLHTDELELREGDAVCVVERCDDGWYVGAAAGSGKFGIFPGNYVVRQEN